jgi:hypothetical protein
MNDQRLHVEVSVPPLWLDEAATPWPVIASLVGAALQREADAGREPMREILITLQVAPS